MAILVCGGAGYIGSHFVKKLKEENEDVIVLDSLITGHRESVPKDVTFYKVNLLHKEEVKKVFKKHTIEAVINFAAFSIVSESMENPLSYFENNFCSTMVLLDVMEEFKVNKLIFSSTAAVYGNPMLDKIDEKVNENPLNPYGESKLAIERMIKWQSNAKGLRYVSLRYFNVAGASLDSTIGELHNNETHIIPIALKVALGNGTFNIFGNDFNTKDGTCTRDYIHVVDLCDAHYLALKYLRDNKPSNIFNLGNGNGYSNLEIINEVKKITGIDFKVVIGERRKGDPDILVADSSKANRILNWEPKHGELKEIIKSAYDFFVNYNRLK